MNAASSLLGENLPQVESQPVSAVTVSLSAAAFAVAAAAVAAVAAAVAVADEAAEDLCKSLLQVL